MTASLTCAMHADCKAAVTHIDDSGFVYCAKHGAQRKMGGRLCRALRPAEVSTLLRGETITYAKARTRGIR